MFAARPDAARGRRVRAVQADPGASGPAFGHSNSRVRGGGGPKRWIKVTALNMGGRRTTEPRRSGIESCLARILATLRGTRAGRGGHGGPLRPFINDRERPEVDLVGQRVRLRGRGGAPHATGVALLREAFRSKPGQAAVRAQPLRRVVGEGGYETEDGVVRV